MAGEWNGTVFDGRFEGDTAQGGDADEILYGNGGSDTLRGGGGSDQLYAGTFDGKIGADDVDKLYGEEGDDFLSGYLLAPKKSVIDGGDGNDSASFYASVGNDASAPRKVSFKLTQTGSFVTIDGDESAYVKGVEQLQIYNYRDQLNITGGSRDDYIYATGKGSVLRGGGGNDGLGAALATGFKVYVDAGSGDKDSLDLQNTERLTLTMSGDPGSKKGATLKSGDTTVATVKGVDRLSVIGGNGDDVLTGGSGDTSFDTGTGSDRLTTKDGNDRLAVDIATGKDTIKAGGGTDFLTMRTGATAEAVVMSGSLADLTVKVGTEKARTVLTATSVEGVDISGGAGDDKFFGGKENDRFRLGGGANSVSAGDGNDFISVEVDDKLDKKIDGGKGFNTLELSVPFQETRNIVMKLTSADGFDVTLGGEKAMHVTGVHAITMQGYGSQGDDTLFGLAADDVLQGGNGADTLSGDDGNDRLDGGYDDKTDMLEGGSGDDNLFTGGSGRDKLDGGSGNDTLSGAGKLDGGSGNDELFTASGGTLIGGSGNDFASMAMGSEAAGLSVTLVKGKTVEARLGDAVVATLSGIEGVGGGEGDDHLTGDSGDNRISGGVGSDTLDGGGGVDTVDFTTSMNFANRGYEITLLGSKKFLVDVTGEFTDLFDKDTIRNFENVTGSIYDDAITGDGKDNRLDGGDGADRLVGGGGDDTLVDGTRIFVGADTMKGGTGDDTYEVHGAHSVIVEKKKQGFDTVIAYTDVTLGKGQAIEKIVATGEEPEPGFGYDSVRLAGNELANTIEGWKGIDTLTGGGGADNFVFRFAPSKENRSFDEITDFKVGQDKIQLDDKAFKAFEKGEDVADADFFVIPKGKKLSPDYKEHLIYHSETGYLYYDSDGSKGKAELLAFAKLDTGLKLGADDFQII